MTAAEPKLSLNSHKDTIFVSTLLIVAAYLTDNVLDGVLEGEDISGQLLSPLRVAMVATLLVLSYYVLRTVIRNNLLKKSYQLHIAAMESSMDGIAIFDEDYRLIYSNSAHTSLYGYQNGAELTGKSWRAFYPEDQVARFDAQVLPALKSEGEWRGETIGSRKDGSRFPQEVSLTRMKTGGVIRIARDITEKKKYQLELERRAQELTATNGELKTFSYSLSHDMRSHIARVSSAGQMLQESYAKTMDDDGRFLVGTITTASDEMEQLVESIERLSSISRSSIRLERIDLSLMVAAIAAEMTLNDPARSVDFVIAPGVSALCDQKLAKVALDNLVGNAWKYSSLSSPARIEFGVERAGAKELFFVRDNGLGFEMSEAPRLFEPFLRLPNARTFPGTGIGLATVQRVIQIHDGELQAFGEPGKGATFYFSFADPA